MTAVRAKGATGKADKLFRFRLEARASLAFASESMGAPSMRRIWGLFQNATALHGVCCARAANLLGG